MENYRVPTGAKPWIDASNADMDAHILTRVSDNKRFLLIGATTDERQARAWADRQLETEEDE